MCWLARAHSEPPSQNSFFQIGTVALSVSMPNWQASKAAPRWGVETATTTDDSVSCTRPSRCHSTMRPISGQRRRASAASSERRGRTCSA